MYISNIISPYSAFARTHCNFNMHDLRACANSQCMQYILWITYIFSALRAAQRSAPRLKYLAYKVTESDSAIWKVISILLVRYADFIPFKAIMPNFFIFLHCFLLFSLYFSFFISSHKVKMLHSRSSSVSSIMIYMENKWNPGSSANKRVEI